jgi:MoaA/NifB/PqqE/SkfB family radical SAM enzyme
VTALLDRLRSSWHRRRIAVWQIELTTRCPLDCRMCIRQGREWRNGDLPLADFERLAPLLAGAESVVLQGWGEPLLHHDLVDIVGLARRAGRPEPSADAPSVGFVTSGKGLDRRYAEALVDAGLDFIGFSVAGATAAVHGAIRVRSDLDGVVEAAQHIAAVKRDRGLNGPRVHVVCLMVKDNVHELPRLPELARRMGASELVLTNLVDVSDAWQDGQRVFRCDGEEPFPELLAETGRRAREAGVALRRPALTPQATAVCEEDPLRNVFVSVEGDVTPCVYLCPPVTEVFPRRFCGAVHQVERLRFGNLFREPFEAVWSSPAYVAFRERFARRAASRRPLALVDRGSSPDSVEEPELPEPPDPCRTCHKLLGL